MINSSESLDDLFLALSDSHRRQVLFALLDHNPQEEVVVPNNVPLGKADYELLRVEMHHVHLPKLEEMGFIKWDRETQQVVKGPEFSEIRPLLETLREGPAES